MKIPAYQMHNVLKVYGKQLSQRRMWCQQKGAAPRAESDKITLSAEGKRQAIIDQVAADVVDRITRFGPQEQMDHTIVRRLRQQSRQAAAEAEAARAAEPSAKGEFVFHVLDEADAKQPASLSFDTSEELTRQLEKLAREAVSDDLDPTTPE